MGLNLDDDGKRIFTPRLLGGLKAPPGKFDHSGMEAVDHRGGVAVWTTSLANYRYANNPATLAAYDPGGSTPIRTLLVPAMPVGWAKAALMPGGDWIIGGQTAEGHGLLRVLTPTGATRAECAPVDSVDQIVTDSDGFVWVLGSALTKYDQSLRQLWQSPGGIREDGTTDVVNLGRGEVIAGQSDIDGHVVLLRIRDGHDTRVIPVPGVDLLDLVIVDGDWVGIMADIESTMIVGTVSGDEFQERFRVQMVEEDGEELCADEAPCRGGTAYLSDGAQWYVLTLAELLADPPQPAPQDAPTGWRGWFGQGRG